MPSTRLTLTVIARMKPGDTVWDTDVKGFGARYRSGVISYVYKKRVAGQQVWLTIGRHGSPWTPETARRKALSLAADAASGINHSELKRTHKAKLTFAEVADQFIADHGKKLKPSSRSDYERYIRTYLKPQFGSLKIDAITHTHVATAHAGWSRTPRSANLAISVMSKLMSWSEDHNLVPPHSNPCRRIKRYKETKRERYLTGSEIERLMATLDEFDGTETETPYVTAAVRLLLLTGARHTEITTLKWSYVDLETATLWLPDSKTGRRAIRLNPQAVDILAGLAPVENNPYVIVGHVTGGHVVNMQKAWHRIRAAASLGTDVRIHDLRHSFASIAINSGASLAMVGKLLGHASPVTTARYAHLAEDPLREVSARVGAKIAGSKTK